MSDLDFFKPQRQSQVGILLIFATSLFQMVRNFWVLGVYFFVQDINAEVLFYSGLGLITVLILTFGYSLLYYWKFIFYIDREKEEFVLEKGVLSTEVISIPFNKIQHVNFKRNLLQRLIGVYSVLIDTAGSKEKEVEIKALSKEQTDLLGDLLTQYSAREIEGEQSEYNEDKSSESVAEEGEAEWEYKLSFATLLKLGLTSNYFRGLMVLVAFFFSLQEQLNISNYIDLPDFVGMEILTTTIIIIGLVLLGMLITIAETFIKYYNLRLKKGKSDIQVEMGLRENTRVNLNSRRVQLLEIGANPIQKKLDLYKLKLFLASSQDDITKDQIQVPGLPSRIVDRACEYFHSSERKEKMEILPHKMALIRRLSRGILPLLIAMGIIWFTSAAFSWGLVWGVGLFYLLVMATFQFFYFRSLKLSVSEDYLTKKSGVWIKKEQIAEMYKLQAVSVSQPLWYKKRNIVNLTFHTAGGDVSFKFVDRDSAVPLVNYLLFKIESTGKPWM